MNRRNYYRLLHVQPDAPFEVIRAAYRALMVKHHPDQGGDHDQAVLLNEAWAVLGDPSRRAEYDAKRADRAQARARGDGPGARRPASPPSPYAPPHAAGDPAGVPTASCPFCTARHWPAEPSCPRCGAPLRRPASARPAAAGGANNKGDGTVTGAERRRLPRVSRADWATMRTAWDQEPVDVRMRNLSLEGVSFFSGVPLADRSRIRLTGAAVDAIVDVLRCTRSGNIFVVQGEFVTVTFAAKAGGFVHTKA